ncbi:Putative pyruvate, phosphate dikinase regulatory protein [bacterium HR39]|nr:Putative pyruvate, phosphate dikinase regulatory protein [bacterium HR39]
MPASPLSAPEGPPVGEAVDGSGKGTGNGPGHPSGEELSRLFREAVQKVTRREPIRLNVHLVSDSTGETVTTVARAALAQFEDVEPVENVWFFVRTREQLERILAVISQRPGLVLYTLVQPELRHRLEEHCRRLDIPCVAVLDPVVHALTVLVGAAGRPRVGRQHALDQSYFRRIEALNFALRHDDGQHVEELDQADVVLVGVSRTSKTPTCMYLAQRGVKAANVPLVPGAPHMTVLERLREPLVVGLTIRPEVLVEIRRTRQRMLGLDPDSDGRYGRDYVDLDAVRREIVQARRLYARMGWPEIDVTRRSVEETAAAVYQMLQMRRRPDLADLGPPPVIPPADPGE